MRLCLFYFALHFYFASHFRFYYSSYFNVENCMSNEESLAILRLFAKQQAEISIFYVFYY
ncbi:hypothetical protein CJI54_04520 [Bifidobacteriaceae bacterium NR026]|nr:hypothetical protein CJI54_04520 [Bifidobacteriaceae bacterium NR026]